MDRDEFRNSLLKYVEDFKGILATDSGDWVVKGFIDVYRNIYTISVDTKVVSKIIELMLFPVLSRFATKCKYKMILCEHQNHYPDITFVAPDDTKFALDLKSTYRVSPEAVNGFTLGAFTGYFRDRRSTKNICFPYRDFEAHYVLGVIYSRNPDAGDERRVYKIDEIVNIASVVKDFTFLLQEKWRLAGDRPGSGNTKNIGSATDINALVHGQGCFASLGESVFDDYWTNYLTNDMARKIESRVPYTNFQGYMKWRRGPRKRSNK